MIKGTKRVFVKARLGCQSGLQAFRVDQPMTSINRFEPDGFA